MLTRTRKVTPVDCQIDAATDPLDLPFLGLIVGRVGAGKTTLLLNLMHEWKGVFHRALLYSPSVHLDAKMEKHLHESVERITTVDELVGALDQVAEERKEDRRYRCLVVLDDVCADDALFPQGRQRTPLNHRLVALRHVGVTCLIVTHSWNMVPKLLRLNARFVFLFRVTEKDFVTILKDLTYPASVLDPIYRRALVAASDFLTLDTVSQAIYFKMQKQPLWCAD